ncbi:MAG: DVU0524 family FlgM-associated protein [Acidobacteriota bacterium]
MVITDYRVQSVLRTYSKQLQRSKLSEKLDSQGQDRKATSEKVTISDEARRRLIMERMTSQVLEKAYPKQESGENPEETAPE